MDYSKKWEGVINLHFYEPITKDIFKRACKLAIADGRMVRIFDGSLVVANVIIHTNKEIHSYSIERKKSEFMMFVNDTIFKCDTDLCNILENNLPTKNVDIHSLI